jgi:hypothetical protein
MNRPVQGKELATPIEHFRIEVTAMATMAAVTLRAFGNAKVETREL